VEFHGSLLPTNLYPDLIGGAEWVDLGRESSERCVKLGLRKAATAARVTRAGGTDSG